MLMSLAGLHKYTFPILLLLYGCVAAGSQGEHRASKVETPYVSLLDEPQSNAYFYYTRARMLLADADYEGAAADYLKAIDFDPDDEDLRFELAELYLAMKQPEKAVRTMEDLILRNPDSVRANLTLANAYFSSNQPAEAVPYYRRVLELDPEKEGVRLHLAIALVRAGSVDLASAELKALLKENPDSLPGRLAMARLYRETGLNKLAAEEYRELIRRSPGVDQAYLELGLLYEEQEDWQKALDVFTEVQQQRPLDFALRHHLSRVYVGMNRYDDALEELSIIVELKPDDFDARRKVGLIYLEQERWQDAVAVFKEILDLKPDLESARYYLGTAYERESEWTLALEAFLGIESDSPFYDDAIAHIGYIYLETGRIEAAVSTLETRTASARPRPQIFNYLASLYMAQGESDLALTTVVKGLELYPENTDLLYQKALFLERAGLHQDAFETMTTLLDFDDKHAEALNFLAYALADENRDLDLALDYAEQAIKLKPAPHILDTLGWVYFRMGRLIEALKAVEEASVELSEDAIVFEHLGEIHQALNNLEQARFAYEKSLQLAPDNDTLREKLETLSDTM